MLVSVLAIVTPAAAAPADSSSEEDVAEPLKSSTEMVSTASVLPRAEVAAEPRAPPSPTLLHTHRPTARTAPRENHSHGILERVRVMFGVSTFLPYSLVPRFVRNY